MGRLATDLAATVTMADNLPPKEKLPKVSFLDALLPRSIFAPKPLGTRNDSVRSGGGDVEIRKNKHGEMSLVHHRGSSGRAASAVGSADAKDEEKVTTENVKKHEGGGGGGGGKKGQNEAEEKEADGAAKEADGEAKEAGFSAEEDAKLTELKSSKKGVSWAKIAEEMGRPVGELKAHWKEINPDAQGNNQKGGQGGQAKQSGEGKSGKQSNDQGGRGGNNQQGGGKKKGPKEWTAEDDAKLKEMWAADKDYAEIQKELRCSKKEVNARWAKIGGKGEPSETQGGGDLKKPGPNAEWTEDDDRKLKELWAANQTVKQIAKALGKPRPAVEARWKQIGDDGAAAAAADEKPAETRGDEAAQDAPKKPSSVKAAKGEPKKPPSSVKAASVVSTARSHRSEARFTMGEWIELSEDDLFSFQELSLLSTILYKDPRQNWLRVASRFYDQTGRRVHPDDIREKFEAMAAMG